MTEPPDPSELVAQSSTWRDSDSNRVVVLGASLAGLRAALTLDRLLVGHRRHEIVLVDQNDYHQIRPRFASVAGGFSKPQSATVPIRSLLGARRIAFRKARVESISFDRHRVRTSDGEIPYRSLILALGAESAPSGLDGLDQIGQRVWSVDDARLLGERVTRTVREAAWKLSADDRARLSTIAVLGGSRFGVELAGALSERVRTLATHFRLPAAFGRVYLIESADRLLPTDPRGLSEAASDALTATGVELRLGTVVSRATTESVELASGERIPAGLVVRTSIGRAPGVVRAAGAPLGRDGRLLVDRELRLPEHPGVYAVGSGIAILGDDLDGEPSLSATVRQGEIAARNAYSDLVATSDSIPSRGHYLEETGDVVLSVGERGVVAQVRGLTVADWRARLAGKSAEVAYFDAIGGPGGLVAGLSSGALGFGRLFGRRG